MNISNACLAVGRLSTNRGTHKNVSLAFVRFSSVNIGKLLASDEFLNCQSKVLPGPERIRITTIPAITQLDPLPYPRTVYEAFKYAATINPSKRLFGYLDEARKIHWMEYDEFFEQSEEVGSALHQMGAHNKDLVALNWINSPEFMVAKYANTSYQCITCPLYPNLGAEAVTHIFKQAQAKIVFCDLESKAEFIMDNFESFPTIRYIVTRTKVSRDIQNKARALNINMMDFKECRELGRKHHRPPIPPEPDYIYTLVYTSGTTGLPKGGMITHDAMLKGFHVVNDCVGPMRVRPGQVAISYMPTGHIYELVYQLMVLANGGSLVFYRGVLKEVMDDLQAVAPNFIPLVPRIMNRIYDGVYSALSNKPVKRAIFNYCFQKKKRYMEKSRTVTKSTIWDRIAFRQVQQVLGGNAECIITTSAPLSHEVMQFFKVVFGCYVTEVYGSTEVMLGTGTSPFDLNGGHIGCPFPFCQVKLIDVPELGYFSKDDCGEICVRSPMTFRGYYKNIEATKLAMRDGWVLTGDVGRWLPNGTLKIIDRKKDIFKLAQGEYIAPERLESCYSRMDEIQIAFVDGRADQNFPVAIVVPEEKPFREWIAKNKLNADQPWEQLCADKAVRVAFLRDMRKLGASYQLSGLEQVQNVWISAEPFTIDNGILTNTLKLKRNVARQRFDEIIRNLYEEGSLES